MLDASAAAVLQPDASRTCEQTRQPAQPCGRIWRVAYTHPQAEHRANAELQRRGYQTWLPLVWTTRCDRVVWRLRHRIQVPAFPRYLFVLADGQWTPIRYTAGVADLVWAEPGKPGTVADSLVAAVRSALEAFDGQDGGEVAWKPGQPCSLATASPLAGLPAVVIAVHGNACDIAVMFLGHLRTLHDVPADRLVPREAEP